MWEITLACCFSCKYCGSNGGHARENELTTIECFDVIKQLSENGCRRVNLIGGEAFMRKDWYEIVAKLKEYGIKTTIITNGYLFTDEIVNKLKKLEVESIAVSLDSVEEIHDECRQKGSFSRAIKAIKILTENQIRVTVISTLNEKNVEYLEDFYQVLAQYPIIAWQLQACSPMGNAVKTNINFRFNFNKVIDFVDKYRNLAPFVVGIADNIGYYTENEGYLRGDFTGGYSFVGCRAGLASIGIDSIGNVRGCESMYADEFIEGNLRDTTLREIWENPDGFAYNRKFKKDMLTGKCRECDKAIYCAGGCRSYNYFVHKKMYESPFCAREV